jgi:capsular polysaccharide export protein
MPPHEGATGPVYAWGFSQRKATMLCRFLGAKRVHRVAGARPVPAGATLYVWGSCPVPRDLATRLDVVRVEDGFLRSVGLGADLVRPLSWVLDHSGIYYDASSSSDLENLIARSGRSAEELARARALRLAVVEARLTKYNVGNATWRRPASAHRVLLVPGQVEDDSSILCSALDVRTNLALLERVRRANPSAYVVYKPHPDVQARLRSGGTSLAALSRLCDEVAGDIGMDALLEHVDEVHTMTSLAGFEALLRGKVVTTYGMPFYAGWGLTTDLGLRAEVAMRRQARPGLDDLVAATLIEYPTYVCPSSGALTTPERTLKTLRHWRRHAPQAGATIWQRAMRPFLAWADRRRRAARVALNP